MLPSPDPEWNVLKALAGTSWGQPQENLVVTYKALLKPILSYAAPVWFANASDSAWTPSRSSRTLLSESPLALWRWPLGCTFIGRRNSCPSVSHMPSRAVFFTLDIHQTPSSDLPLAKEPFATTTSHASSPASSSFSRLIAPSYPLTTLRCFVFCTNQRSLWRSGPCPPTGSSASPLPTLLKKSNFFPAPHRVALLQVHSSFSLALSDNLHRFSHVPSPPLLVVDLWERLRESTAFISSLPSFSHLSLHPPGAPGSMSLPLLQVFYQETSIIECIYVLI